MKPLPLHLLLVAGSVPSSLGPGRPFVVTLKTRDALIANFYRVVNNVDLPLSVDHSKFSEAQAGELTRTK